MARTQTEEVREHLDLFGWAKLEAQRVEQARRELAERIEAANDAALTLAGTAEQIALEQAKADLKSAREAALEEDLPVQEAQAALKAARKKVRALAAAQDAKRLKGEAREIEQGVQQRERDIAAALARGEAPGQQADPEMSNLTVEFIGPDGQSSGKIPAKDFSRRVGEAAKVLHKGARKS